MLHVNGIATRVHRALVFAYDDVYDRRGRLKEDDRWAMEYSVRDGAAVVELFHATASCEFKSLGTAELRASDHQLAEYFPAIFFLSQGIAELVGGKLGPEGAKAKVEFVISWGN